MITKGRKNVANAITPSGLLTPGIDLISPSCNNVGFLYNLILWYQMTDISNDVSRDCNSHNHTNVQETKSLHTTNCVSKSGFRFHQKKKNFTYVSSWKKNVARVVLKLFITITMRIML